MLTVYLLSSNVCISSSVSINLYRSNSSWSNIFILIKFYWQVDILAVVLGKTLHKKCMSRSEHELYGSQYLMRCQMFYCNESVFQRKSTCGYQVSCDWWRGGHVTAILISIGHLAALATQSDPGQDGPGQRLQDRWQQFLGLVRGRLLLSQKQTSRGGIFHSNII